MTADVIIGKALSKGRVPPSLRPKERLASVFIYFSGHLFMLLKKLFMEVLLSLFIHAIKHIFMVIREVYYLIRG